MTAAVLDGRRLLVITYGHLADVLAAVPALRSLHRACPSARIEVLALRSVAPLLEPCSYVDELVTWGDFRHKGSHAARAEKAVVVAGLAARLRGRRYDAVLVLHRSFRAMRTLARLTGAPVTAGISDGGDGYSHPVAPDDSVSGSRTENRRVLEAVGVEEDGQEPEVWTTAEEARTAEGLLAPGVGHPLVGLHGGSDWSCQQWLPDRLGDVGVALEEASGARIVLTGALSERALAAEVAERLRGPFIDLAGRTTFGELVEVIRRLDLLVTVNSAPAAVAEVVGTPSVVLLGPEDARFTGLTEGAARRVVQPEGAGAAGGWCELGRWGILSGCESPICRGLGGLGRLETGTVVRPALELLGTPRP